MLKGASYGCYLLTAIKWGKNPEFVLYKPYCHNCVCLWWNMIARYCTNFASWNGAHLGWLLILHKNEDNHPETAPKYFTIILFYPTFDLLVVCIKSDNFGQVRAAIGWFSSFYHIKTKNEGLNPKIAPFQKSMCCIAFVDICLLYLISLIVIMCLGLL